MEIKFDFDDILLKPAVISTIDSRHTIFPYDENGMLPIFTAPMIDVVGDYKSQARFSTERIYVVKPRKKNPTKGDLKSTSNSFVAVSLDDFRKLFCKGYTRNKEYVLIDIANGHQEQLFEMIHKTKKVCHNITMMVGNVANPKTYVELSNAGADYVRIGIGNGSGCLTTEQTGIGYPTASLIRDVYNESLNLKEPAKIVADGGIRKFSDITKSLALGADYVMIGGVFNKALESSGDTYLWKKFKVNQHGELAYWLFKHNYKLYKKFRGMSTKEVQSLIGNKPLITSEGITKYNHVRWTVGGWTDNFRHYLRTTMSYTGAKTLEEFIGKVEYNMITTNAYKRFNK